MKSLHNGPAEEHRSATDMRRACELLAMEAPYTFRAVGGRLASGNLLEIQQDNHGFNIYFTRGSDGHKTTLLLSQAGMTALLMGIDFLLKQPFTSATIEE